MKTYAVNEKNTLKSFTDNACAQASFRFRILLKEGRIRVNGKRVFHDTPLNAGDRVDYYLTEKEEKKTAFTILFEDENIIVIDKEDGVNSEAVFSALSERGEVKFIHRLDRNTAGVMVFAKNDKAEEELLAVFRDRRVEKSYLALVVGTPLNPHAVEEAFLKKDDKNSRVHISLNAGEKIVTEYKVLENRGETCLLRVTLHTGKTHQIRAHLAYLGFPVAGDEKYGDSAFNKAHNMTRQRLVSKELRLNCEGALSYLQGQTFVSSREL